MFEALLVISVEAAMKAQGPLHFVPDYNLATQWIVPAKGIVKASHNRLFFILVNSTSNRLRKVDKK